MRVKEFIVENNLKSFRKSLSNAVRGELSQMTANTGIAKASGKFKWDIGDILYSQQTGKTYPITSLIVQRGIPKYIYKRDDESGALIADLAHKNLLKINKTVNETNQVYSTKIQPISLSERKKHKRKKNRTPKSITTGWWGGYFGSSESGDGGGVEESNKGVAEGSENNTTAQKIFFARSNKAPKGWSYDHVGFITQDGKQIQMSGHKGNEVYVTNAVTDDPEFPKQKIKIVSLSKPVSVPTTNSVGAENCGTFVANVLQANGIKGIDTQKLYSVMKKPLKQGVAEEFTFNQPRKKLSIPLLIKRKAIFITHPHGPNGWETDKPEWDFSLITLQNVLEKSPSWTSEYKKYIRPESYSHATQQFFDKLSDQKYNQILWSIKKLGIPDNVAFLNYEQGMSEDSYKEGGSITHDGVEYDFDKVLATAETKPTKQCPVSKLKWVLEYDKPDINRLKNADISVPVVITKSNNGELTVIDGLHRLAKAVDKNVNLLPVKYITNDELQSARLKQGVAEGSLNEFSINHGDGDDDDDNRGPGLTRQEFKNALKLALGYDMNGVNVSTFERGMLRVEVNDERRIVPCNKLGVKDAANFIKTIRKQGMVEGQENKMSAEEYKKKLLDNLPFMMKFLSQGVKGWAPSEQDMLDGIEIGYEKMKQTGDVKQAGAALRQYLNTLYNNSILDEIKNLDINKKIIFLEEYHTKNGVLTESNTEGNIKQFNSLHSLTVKPVTGKNYIVVSLMLISDKIMMFEMPILGEFIDYNDEQLKFIDTKTGNEKIFPPPITNRVKSITSTFVFDSKVKYNKFALLLMLKWDLKLPDITVPQLTENNNKVIDTAKHMYEKYKGQSYTAHQRATDHAISYESNTPQFHYWSSVAAEISRLEKETSK